MEGSQKLEGGEVFESMTYVYSTKKLRYSIKEIKESLIALVLENPAAKEPAKIAYGELCYFKEDIEDKIKTGGPDLSSITEMSNLINSGADASEIAKRYLKESSNNDYVIDFADETEKLHKEFEDTLAHSGNTPS